MLHMQPDRPGPQTLRRPTAAACLAMAAFLAAAGHAQAGVINLNFDESKSGNYSAEAKLDSNKSGQGTVTADISFNNVPLDTTAPEQKKLTIGPFYSSANIAGYVVRSFRGTYMVAPMLAGAVISSDLQTWPINTGPAVNRLSISATYTDTFWITNTGNGGNVLGISFSVVSPMITYPDIGYDNAVSLSLVFADANDPTSAITIDTTFDPNTPTERINIAFDQMGPNALYTMEMNFYLTSTVRPSGSPAQPSPTLVLNPSQDGTIEGLPVALIQITDEIPGVIVKHIPEPTSLALLGLGGLALPARRRRGSAAGSHGGDRPLIP